MSTRCQIGFYSDKEQDADRPDVLIYRHSDGYPGSIEHEESGVVPDLLPFLRVFNERRGLSDTAYASAWTMWHLIALSVEHHKEFCTTYPSSAGNPLPKDTDGITGLSHGIDAPDDWHTDTEFYYAVYPNRLDVYDVAFGKMPSEAALVENHAI